MANWDGGEQAVGLRRGSFQRKRRRDMLVACLASAALRLQQAESEATAGEAEKSSAAGRQQRQEVLRREFVHLRSALLALDTFEPQLQQQQHEQQQQQFSVSRVKESRSHCLCSGNEAEEFSDEALPWRERDSRLKRQRTGSNEHLDLFAAQVGAATPATLHAGTAAVCPSRLLHQPPGDFPPND